VTASARASSVFIDTERSAKSEAIRRCLELAGLDLISDSWRAAGSHLILITACLDDSAVTVVRDAAMRMGSRVLVISSDLEVDRHSIWQLLRAGAGDVVVWRADRGTQLAEGIAARVRRWQEVDEVMHSEAVRERLVGQSRAWLDVVAQLVEVARLPDVSVLLTGETGTGKELAARLIHELDPRRDKRDLVIVDCTTIVPSLAGSEFFGHERGAFTDAVSTREGAFFEADRGTLFLDELGELPLGLQPELLRVVQEGTYKRIGSGMWRQSRFRLVCATNRNLADEVAAGRFRADLYHRLAAWTIRLPPLHERPDDIPRLAAHFLKQLRPELGEPAIDAAVLDVIQRRVYPGNVRELRQLVTRVAGRHVGPAPISVGDLPPDERPSIESHEQHEINGTLERWVRAALDGRAALRDIRRAAEDTAIAVALEKCDGNLQRASRLLKITDRALQMRRAAARRNGTGG
jgi:transcriptional regulator with GAF, ATPase, and Fis domain